MNRVHPLHSEVAPPERFTYPFFYEPHPLCRQAAAEVQQELLTMDLTEGKMFGVLVVQVPGGADAAAAGGRLGFLAAYSGLLSGRNDWPYFVPPVYDAQQPDGHFKQTERRISAINAELKLLEQGDKVEELKALRRSMSEDLQTWLFQQYQLLNARGERRGLVQLWQDYHCAPSIRRRYPLPPGGTGDCCAPKLLQYAYSHGLRPVAMAEFWWGPSPKSEVRHHGRFYPACRGKCKPLLTWMLQGLSVDPDPESLGFPHLRVDIVYEDDSLIVVNKPSGLLSIPGRKEYFSVATQMQRRRPGSMLVHRLDMWTSGLLLLAKSKEAYHALQRQFVERTVRKRYVALLEGVPQTTAGQVRLPLLCDPINRPRQVVDYDRGKTAVTDYEVIGIENGRARVALYPHTGRTHQLRVHCAHADGLNCPIVGDELYGHHTGERLCLHAEQLWLTHPLSGQPLHFVRPADF